MGDHSSDRYSDESSEEEYITEEYETYFMPHDVIIEEPEEEEDSRRLSDKNLDYNSETNTEKRDIKTITRIDEDTEDVVILIRPRRRSVSPTEVNCQTNLDLTNKENCHKDDSYFNHAKEQTSNLTGNQNGQTVTQSECSNSINYSGEENGSVNYLKGNNVFDGNDNICPKEANASSFKTDCLISTQSLFQTNKDTDIPNETNSEMKEKYQQQGARPKTPLNFGIPVREHTVSKILTQETETPPHLAQKLSSRYGISKEANEKVKKLKEIGKYDELVKNSHIQRNKGVVHDLVRKINMDNSDPETTDEDDILIWNLMKSLRERSVENESDGKVNMNDNFNTKNHRPQGKCDWSYEKANLKKDKYLSKRLQTKEIGQVKIVTFLSSVKDDENISIKPLKVSKTLPFNVKNIFQQKMDEVKNQNKSVYLIDGNELKFTTMAVDEMNKLS